ncbi:MAG: hypothetical protein ACLTBV_17375 [Enterocloster bolteae]
MKKRVLVVGATKETTFSVHRKCLLYILFYLLASNPWHMFFREQFFEQFLDGEYILTTIACIHICPTRVDSFAVEKAKIRASRLIERRSPKRDCDAFLLCHSKNKTTCSAGGVEYLQIKATPV